MTRPRVTFACELDPTRLTALVSDGSVVQDLQALDARVALMLSDFSPERAAVVRTLNSAGVWVVGIPLMPYHPTPRRRTPHRIHPPAAAAGAGGRHD